MMKKEIRWLLKEKYHGKPNIQFGKDIERLKRGEPLDYVIGFIEFLGCKIDLSKKPLIPRPETEYWVGKAVEEISNPSTRLTRSGQNLQILDIFSGSGCIGVSIMRHIKNSNVTFAEKERKFLHQIKINCKLNELKNYHVVQSDIFSNVKGKYSYIFANPPYIPENQDSRFKIQESVLKFEPPTALFGGKDGLFYIRKFLAKAKNFLNPGGKIYMEFDSMPSTLRQVQGRLGLRPSHKKQIEKLIKKLNYEKFEFYKDQYGKWRLVVIQ